MIVEYKDCPVLIISKENSKVYTLIEAIQERVVDDLLRTEDIKLNLKASDNEFGISLISSSTNKMSVNTIVPVIHIIEDETNIKAKLVRNSLVQISEKLGVSFMDFVLKIKKVEDTIDILDGKIAPPKKLEKSANLFLQRLIGKINDKYYPATLAKTTVKMDSPSTELVLQLPHPNDIITKDYTLPDIKALYTVPEEVKTAKWREYTSTHGIPDTYIVGSDDNNKTGILSNEMLLLKQLKDIFAHCVKAEFDISPTSEEFEMMRPKAFIEFMKNMLYIALKHNWDHTVMVPTLVDVENLVDSEDDEDSDYEDEDKARNVSMSNAIFEYSDSDMFLTLSKLRKAGVIRINTNLIPEARNAVFDFITMLESKKPSYMYYIEAFIKLIRWGDRKISKLYLGDVDNIYLDLDLFIRKEDYSNDPSRPVLIDGCPLLVEKVVYLEINPSVNLKEIADISGDIDYIVPGIFCVKTLESIENPGRQYYHTYYMDALKVLEVYKNKDTENYIYGIKYENGKFTATNNQQLKVFQGFATDLTHAQAVNEYTFTIHPSNEVCQIADLLLKDFMDKQVPNKKAELNLPNLIIQTKHNSISDIPVYLQDWVMKVLKIYKVATDSDVNKLDFISLLNLLNKSIDKIDKEGISFEPSNRFQEKDDQVKTEVEDDKGEEDYMNIDRSKFFSTGSLREGYRVLRPDGRLYCYLEPKTGALYEKDAIVDTILTDKEITIAMIIGAFVKKAVKNPELKKLIHYLVEEM